jgi:DNA-directed RNA polymerase specialized sigma24 family protein
MVDSHERDAAYEAAWSRSLAVAMRQGLSRHDAEDVAVDALERLWRAAAARQPRRLGATVTKNLVVDARRAAAARPPQRPGRLGRQPGRQPWCSCARATVSAGHAGTCIAQVWAELENVESRRCGSLGSLRESGQLGYGNARSVDHQNRIRSDHGRRCDIRREMSTHPRYG